MIDKKESGKVGAVLIIGGGITGMQESLDLADSGFKVYLLDKTPSIGGKMAELDKTFPTNDCSMCILSPKLVETGRHYNVKLLTNAEVEKIDGKEGNFKVLIRRKVRHVNEEKCTGCLICTQRCPIEVKDDYNKKLKLRKAIYLKYPQAVPSIVAIDTENCIGCGICETQCEAKAIDFSQKEEFVELNVGSIILSPGFQEFDLRRKPEYGYSIFKNVISSIELERMLSATGPYNGLVLRPSDGEIPKKVAFIQCVGSRDKTVGHSYCSSVCCMFAIKESVIAKEHCQSLQPTIFFMDMRAYGKEFEEYYNRASKEHGIRFVKNNRISNIEKLENDNLRVWYIEDGRLKSEDFEMVVLAVGAERPRDAKILAEHFGINLNQDGFCETDIFSPLNTSKEGIFVSGAFSSPKDIPDSVAQASGASSKAGALISSENKLMTVKQYPEEIDVKGQEPRIGVFVCHCGINIAGVVNVPNVVEYAKTLPNVVHAENNLYTCSQDTQKRIKEKIKEFNLNRVVVASCTPRTHEPLFMDTCREGGLNSYLFEMANIREQCSWVHSHEKEKATKKAKDLVRMAVAKSRMHEPLKKISIPINRKALVIGGGLSGMISALELTEQGFRAFLVEKEKELGGLMRKIHYDLQGRNLDFHINNLIKKINENQKIKVYTNAEVVEVNGRIGDFKGKVISDGKEETIDFGIVIVATGGKELKINEYLYGKDNRILTQLELEDLIVKDKFNAKKIVMIQCVGSRNEERPYCSRICCTEAVKNALKIKEISPETEVYILYRDMRTYGFRENFYELASKKGVIFIRYEEDEKPMVLINGKNLKVEIKEQFLEKNVVINPDLIILSVATTPNEDNEKIGKLLKVPLTKDKFFLEAHMKLRPLDFATEGMFLCGLAHSPKFIEECISQSSGAVSRAVTILSKDFIELEPTISTVIDENCDGCAFCIEPCPYKAITLIEYMKDSTVKKTVEVDETLCKGCGCCMASCPKKGIYVKRFKLEQLSAMVDAFLEEESV